ncbi:MAG: hypothetical protein ACO3CR_00410 [Solirubrobacterales bacterium]
MRAEYDSEADALSISLIDAPRWEESVVIDDSYCRLELAKGVPVNIELLSPSKSLHLLDLAAERAGIDPEEVHAAARSALAAPDTVVSLTFSAPAGSSDPGR